MMKEERRDFEGGEEERVLVVLKGFRSKLCIPMEEVIKGEPAVMKGSRLCVCSYSENELLK